MAGVVLPLVTVVLAATSHLEPALSGYGLLWGNEDWKDWNSEGVHNVVGGHVERMYEVHKSFLLIYVNTSPNSMHAGACLKLMSAQLFSCAHRLSKPSH
jgi:hypothetical protein